MRVPYPFHTDKLKSCLQTLTIRILLSCKNHCNRLNSLISAGNVPLYNEHACSDVCVCMWKKIHRMQQRKTMTNMNSPRRIDRSPMKQQHTCLFEIVR